jgi:hypothetical protein
VPKPALVVVDDEAHTLEVLGQERGTRYGAEYSVVAESSPVRALGRTARP